MLVHTTDRLVIRKFCVIRAYFKAIQSGIFTVYSLKYIKYSLTLTEIRLSLSPSISSSTRGTETFINTLNCLLVLPTQCHILLDSI